MFGRYYDFCGLSYQFGRPEYRPKRSQVIKGKKRRKRGKRK